MSTGTGRRVIVEADGGSRGNPGPAGFGAVVRDAETGAVLAERAEAIGSETNNVAEYRGLIAGLTAARELGSTQVDVRLDSKLVVEQMSGRWKIKNPAMQQLATRARGIVVELGEVRFSWVPRARNVHADRLANEAMDAAADGRSVAPGGDGDSVRTVAPSMVSSAPAAPSMVATTLILLRHGRTPLTEAHRFSGAGPAELSEAGQAEAAALADRIARDAARPGAVPIDAVVSSPLQRARQTAAPVAASLGIPVLVDDDLAETDFGAWDGYTYAEIGERWPAELTAWLGSADVAPPGGESLAASAARVRRARDRLLATHPGKRVVVVAHGLVIGELLTLALAVPALAARRMRIDPASVSEVAWYADGNATLIRVNDTSHLS